MTSFILARHVRSHLFVREDQSTRHKDHSITIVLHKGLIIGLELYVPFLRIVLLIRLLSPLFSTSGVVAIQAQGRYAALTVMLR
jgi:hypothetical protein